MLHRLKLVLASSLVIPAACQEMPNETPDAKILAIGDSLMAWNSVAQASVPDALEKGLGEPVVDRSVSAAWMQTSSDPNGKPRSGVQAQYIQGDWDWVVVNGGGNDLLMGCGCNWCDATLNTLISSDGRSGQIPNFLRNIRDDGAHVVYFGYLRSPNLITPIEACKSDGDELETRIAKLAKHEDRITFVSMQDIVPPNDASYFAFDLIHPSPKASRMIGQRLASVMREAG